MSDSTVAAKAREYIAANKRLEVVFDGPTEVFDKALDDAEAASAKLKAAVDAEAEEA